MNKEKYLKQRLLQVIISVLLCVFLILLKFVCKREELVESIYNYLIADIVFPS